MNIKKSYFSFFLKPLVFVLACLPLVLLGWNYWVDNLGANPIESITHQTGGWALRFLLITLLISSSKRLLSWSQLILIRRMLGLFAFFYATLHLMTYLWLDQFFFWDEIVTDIVDRPFITIGIAAFILLIPLVLTSPKIMVKLLKKNWKRLHKLAYVIPLLGIIHYWWLVKSDVTEPLIYSLLLLLLLLERIYSYWMRKSKK